MSAWDWIALSLSVGLCVYLFVAMLRPELFD